MCVMCGGSICAYMYLIMLTRVILLCSLISTQSHRSRRFSRNVWPNVSSIHVHLLITRGKSNGRNIRACAEAWIWKFCMRKFRVFVFVFFFFGEEFRECFLYR